MSAVGRDRRKPTQSGRTTAAQKRAKHTARARSKKSAAKRACCGLDSELRLARAARETESSEADAEKMEECRSALPQEVRRIENR
jgi:hypothetical protein